MLGVSALIVGHPSVDKKKRDAGEKDMNAVLLICSGSNDIFCCWPTWCAAAGVHLSSQSSLHHKQVWKDDPRPASPRNLDGGNGGQKQTCYQDRA